MRARRFEADNYLSPISPAPAGQAARAASARQRAAPPVRTLEQRGASRPFSRNGRAANSPPVTARECRSATTARARTVDCLPVSRQAASTTFARIRMASKPLSSRLQASSEIPESLSLRTSLDTPAWTSHRCCVAPAEGKSAVRRAGETVEASARPCRMRGAAPVRGLTAIRPQRQRHLSVASSYAISRLSNSGAGADPRTDFRRPARNDLCSRRRGCSAYDRRDEAPADGTLRRGRARQRPAYHFSLS